MYVCPTCNREFCTEEAVVQHFLNCWKELNPNHKSNPAPHSEDVVVRQVTDEVLNFFESFKKEN